MGLSVAWRARVAGMSVAVFERGVCGAGGHQARRPGCWRPWPSGVRRGRPAPAGHGHALGRDVAGFAAGLSRPRRRGGPAQWARWWWPATRTRRASLQRELAFREGLGLRACAHEVSEARAHELALAPTVRLALHAPEDHSVDPRLVVAALRVACERAGVRLREHTSVAGLELDASATRVLGVKLGWGARQDMVGARGGGRRCGCGGRSGAGGKSDVGGQLGVEGRLGVEPSRGAEAKRTWTFWGKRLRASWSAPAMSLWRWALGAARWPVSLRTLARTCARCRVSHAPARPRRPRPAGGRGALRGRRPRSRGDGRQPP